MLCNNLFLRFLLNELSPILSSKITAAQKLPIIKTESRWKTVINSVVSTIKTKKNNRNHKARNQHLPLQNNSNEEVIISQIFPYGINLNQILIVNMFYYTRKKRITFQCPILNINQQKILSKKV